MVLTTDLVSDHNNLSDLMNRTDSLSTYGDVNVWENDASNLIAHFQSKKSQLENAIRLIEIENNRLEEEYNGLSFFKKLGASKSEISENTKKIENSRKGISIIDGSINKLQTLIDLFPNSPEEKKEFLEELKLTKKELQLQKREINQTIRETRANARVKMASIPTGGGKYIGTFNRMNRASIRLNKEFSVKENENSKEQIEAKLIAIDRIILQISKIK